MVQDGCIPGSNVMILACSGGSNVGQLSNRAAVELTQEGFGKMFCLAGIGGHLGGFVQSAKDVPVMVAIDGCRVGCAKTILEHFEIPPKNYLVITDLGIEKSKDFNLRDDDVQRVKDAVRACCKEDAQKGVAGKSNLDTCTYCG
jgi:uncharacterized metal-binding protein